MIKNVNDICLLIQILKKFNDTTGIKKSDLYSMIRRPNELQIWSIEYDELFDLCKSLNLIEEKNEKILLSKNGNKLIDMQDHQSYLNEEQRTFLFENCIIENSNFKNELGFLRLFSYDENNNTFRLNEKNYPIIKNLKLYVLYGLGIIKKINTYIWEIEKKYSQNIELLNDDIKNKISQHQLDQILLEQKEIGNMAEDLTLKYEIDRLKKMGLAEESNHVQIISKSHVNKGYDIESFSSKNLRPNLFIEVKGRKRHDTSFFISSNEIKMAKKLKNQYVIYFWNNIGRSNLPVKPWRIISNPITTLGIKECNNCVQYLIELDM